MNRRHPLPAGLLPSARTAWLGAWALLMAASASAQQTLVAPPVAAHQMSFSASAQMQVPRDQLSVSLQVMREGSDATQVQNALKQVLDAALAEARRTAEGNAMTVRTSGFSIQPRHGGSRRRSCH